MFKAFTFISHVIYLFRKLEKKFRPLLLLSKEGFLEIRCLKSHFFICVRHAYTVKPSCDKIPHKNCLKTKTWYIARVAPRDNYREKLWLD